MNKNDLVPRVAESSGLTKAIADKAIGVVFDTIGAALARGAVVMTKRFGTLYTTELPARTGRNPKTGVAVSIPAKRTPRFRAGKVLNGAVQG